jgi:hypothetical protein
LLVLQIKLAQLANFFPRISKAVRAATLEKCKGDLEESANELFGVMAELADVDEEEDLDQEDEDSDEDGEQAKYILKSTHQPQDLSSGEGAKGDSEKGDGGEEDADGGWKESNGKSKGSGGGSKTSAGTGEAGASAAGGGSELSLLYSRDEEVAAATGRAEACGHYEILRPQGEIEGDGGLGKELTAANAKVVNVVCMYACCVRRCILAHLLTMTHGVVWTGS